ncbi:aldolase/citrate lyase family protein [Piscinibacter sakaiensis]|uniref:aldolase/citrate lyase family protein n=1 Tax=Piscinibacter sakaiensis TaxID=1547922 RepID=UPI003AAA226B
MSRSDVSPTGIPINRFKRALAAGQVQIGIWNSLASSVAVEVVAGSGFDWMLVDMEHSPNDMPLLHAQLQALMGRPATTPVVRPPWNDTVTIKRLLDVGVQSFLIPYVQNAQEAADAVAATRYPPHGVRGFASASRATNFGRIPGYWQGAHEEICVLVQVETTAALDEIEAIAAVPGVDGIFIGPGDLSASMGYLGQPSHPEVISAIDAAMKRIHAAGKPSGFLTGDEKLARHYLDMGCSFVAVGADLVLLARAADALSARFKSPQG